MKKDPQLQNNLPMVLIKMSVKDYCKLKIYLIILKKLMTGKRQFQLREMMKEKV
jgi:hypothetical protein